MIIYSVCASKRGPVCVCVRVRACVRAFVRACVRACVCVCVCVCCIYISAGCYFSSVFYSVVERFIVMTSHCDKKIAIFFFFFLIVLLIKGPVRRRIMWGLMSSRSSLVDLLIYSTRCV